MYKFSSFSSASASAASQDESQEKPEADEGEAGDRTKCDDEGEAGGRTKWYRDRLKQKDLKLNANAQHIQKDWEAYMNQYNVVNIIPHLLRTPTIVLHCEDDPVVPLFNYYVHP